MSKTVKIWLIIAAVFLLVGGALFVTALSAAAWNFTALSTVSYETTTDEITEDFSSIAVQMKAADVFFVPSEDGTCKVTFEAGTNMEHSVSVEDGVLCVEMTNLEDWHKPVINAGSAKITVYLPENGYSALEVQGSTGDVNIPAEFNFESIHVNVTTGDVACFASVTGAVEFTATTGGICAENISADSLRAVVSTGTVRFTGVTVTEDLTVDVTTGETELTDVNCNNLISTGSSGDVTLHNVIATEQVSIERSTGDVTFEGADAGEIFVETSTGDVEGTLLSHKVFIVATNTGDVDVPESVTGGKCKITTDTGDVFLRIQMGN